MTEVTTSDVRELLVVVADLSGSAWMVDLREICLRRGPRIQTGIRSLLNRLLLGGSASSAARAVELRRARSGIIGRAHELTGKDALGDGIGVLL